MKRRGHLLRLELAESNGHRYRPSCWVDPSQVEMVYETVVDHQVRVWVRTRSGEQFRVVTRDGKGLDGVLESLGLLEAEYGS